MSWSDFQNDATFAVWKPALDVILDESRQYAASHRMPEFTIVPMAWDAPDIEISWSGGGLARNLHVTLANKEWPLEVRFSGAVWLDQPGQERQFRTLELSTVQASNADHLRGQMSANLESAVSQIDQLQLRMAAFRGAHAD